jgi:hypothetical protein
MNPFESLCDLDPDTISNDMFQVKTRNNALNNIWADSKGILVLNLKYEHAISFVNLVKGLGAIRAKIGPTFNDNC